MQTVVMLLSFAVVLAIGFGMVIAMLWAIGWLIRRVQRRL